MIDIDGMLDIRRQIKNTSSTTQGYNKMKIKLHPQQFEDLMILCEKALGRAVKMNHITNDKTGEITKVDPEYTMGCKDTIALFREYFKSNLYIEESKKEDKEYISVKDKLPEKYKYCMVKTSKNEEKIGFYHIINKKFYNNNYLIKDRNIIRFVRYWKNV